MPTIEQRHQAVECGDEWWNVLDGEVLDCLACGRPVSPEEVGAHAGEGGDHGP